MEEDLFVLLDFELDRFLKFHWNILDFLGDGCVVTDENELIKFTNSAFVTFSGWQKADLIGQKINKVIFYEKDRLFLKKKKGKKISVFTNVWSLKDNNGRRIGKLFILRLKDFYLERMRELENLLLFIRGSVHDLNNLLTVLSMNFEMLTYSLSNRDKENSYLKKIESAITRMRELFHRVSMLYEPVQISSLDLKEIIKETSDLVLSDSNVKCNLKIENPLPKVRGDKAQIGQVIQNLIINAKEAMKGKGEIDIKLSLATCAHKEGKWIKIEIKDRGSGISDKILPKIFDPFFSTKSQGRGIGLAVSKRIIEKHGGFIEIFSKEGKGTTFTIYLPAEESL